MVKEEAGDIIAIAISEESSIAAEETYSKSSESTANLGESKVQLVLKNEVIVLLF